MLYSFKSIIFGSGTRKVCFQLRDSFATCNTKRGRQDSPSGVPSHTQGLIAIRLGEKTCLQFGCQSKSKRLDKSYCHCHNGHLWLDCIAT